MTQSQMKLYNEIFMYRKSPNLAIRIRRGLYQDKRSQSFN